MRPLSLPRRCLALSGRAVLARFMKRAVMVSEMSRAAMVQEVQRPLELGTPVGLLEGVFATDMYHSKHNGAGATDTTCSCHFGYECNA